MPNFTAKQILTRMAKIVSADRLVHGSYIQDAEDGVPSNAICRGQNGCAIGSFFLAADVGIIHDEFGINLEGGAMDSPHEFAEATSPAVAGALRALDAAAGAKAAQWGYDRTAVLRTFPSDALIESFYEGVLPRRLPRSPDQTPAMLEVISDAKASL